MKIALLFIIFKNTINCKNGTKASQGLATPALIANLYIGIVLTKYEIINTDEKNDHITE
jgi:Na+/glutamate symporter